MGFPVFQSFRVTVEIPFLLTSFAMMLESALFTNFIVYRTCYTLLDYPKDNCSKLGNEENEMTRWLETQVQPTANDINMVLNTISSVIPIFVCMFVGSWSDKFGRKPFLMGSIAGALVSFTATTFVAYFENMTPWWFIASLIPFVLTGQFASLMLMVTTYTADITTTEQRALRLSVFDVIFALSTFLGYLIAPYIFYATNYVTVYAMCMSLVGFSLLYTIFFIPESLNAQTEVPKSRGVLKLGNVMDIVRDTFKKRPNNGRTHLLAILGIMLLQNFTVGEAYVLPMFYRATMLWNLSKLTLVSSITSIINMIGTVFGTVVLHKMLKVKEFPLVLLSTVLYIISKILQAIATNDYYIYASIIPGAFKGVGGVMLKTVISLIISPAEMGTILAVTSIVTSVDQSIANIVYPKVYNATINTNGGIYNYMSVAVMAIGGILVIYMMTENYTNYEPPTKEELIKSELENKKSINLNSLDIITATQ